MFQFGLLATKQMIHIHPLAYGLDYVQLNWTHPKFLPERYQLEYLCVVKPTCTPNHDMNQSITTSEQNLTLDTTSVRISNILQNSICMLFLLAVYNPASIDSGIVITGTLDEDTGKRTLCLRDCILIILNYIMCCYYCFIIMFIIFLYEDIANIDGRITCTKKSSVLIKKHEWKILRMLDFLISILRKSFRYINFKLGWT